MLGRINHGRSLVASHAMSSDEVAGAEEEIGNALVLEVFGKTLEAGKIGELGCSYLLVDRAAALAGRGKTLQRVIVESIVDVGPGQAKTICIGFIESYAVRGQRALFNQAGHANLARKTVIQSLGQAQTTQTPAGLRI